MKMDRLQLPKMPFAARDAAVEASGAGSSPGWRERFGLRMRGRRLPFLAGLLALLILIDAAVVVFDARQATFNTVYVAVVGKERNLVALGAAVRTINDNNPALLELADEISALSVQSGGSARQNAITAHLVMLTQRMAKNANAMLAGDVVDPQVAFLLGKDTNTFRDLLSALLQANEALRIGRVGDEELRGKLGELESGFRQYQVGVSQILGNMQRLVNAKRATRDIFNDSEALLGAAEDLATGYDTLIAARKFHFVAMGAVS